MPTEIFQLTPDHLDAAAEVLTAAFMDDPFFRFVLDEEGQRRRWLRAVMRANLELTMPHRQTYAIGDERGEILGAILAMPPEAYPPPLLTNLRFLWKTISHPSLFDPGLRKLGPALAYVRAWERMHIKPPHWYVFVVGVDPKWQGRGLGRKLMMSIIQRAETSGNPVYLETQTESNVRFYGGLGFEVIESAHPNLEGPKSWGMLRVIDRIREEEDRADVEAARKSLADPGPDIPLSEIEARLRRVDK